MRGRGRTQRHPIARGGTFLGRQEEADSRGQMKYGKHSRNCVPQVGPCCLTRVGVGGGEGGAGRLLPVGTGSWSSSLMAAEQKRGSK